jgi:hypothetical protein
MEIKVEMHVPSSYEILQPRDLGFDNEEWKALDEDAKRIAISDYLNEEISNRPYWQIVRFTEKED